MPNELVKIEKTTPILDIINKPMMAFFGKNLTEINTDLNGRIEAGVGSDSLLRDANACVQDGRKAIKIINEARLCFTRPIDQAKKDIMAEIESFLYPTTTAVKKLDGMVLAKDAENKAAEAKAKREHEEAQAAAALAALKREETNKRISLAKGGTGEVAKVEPEVIAQSIATFGIRGTVRTKRVKDLDKIQAAVDNGVRSIPGVRIYQVWTFEIIDAAKVPDEYRKTSRG